MKMSATLGFTVSLLLLVSAGHAGLVHPRFRELKEPVAAPVLISDPIASALRKDQIPVTVIELREPESVVQPVQSERLVTVAAVVPEPAAVATDIVAPQTEDLQAALDTAVIAEDIAKAVEQDQKLNTDEAVVEAERRLDEELIEQAVNEEIKLANEQLLRSLAETEQVTDEQQQQHQQDESSQAEPVKQATKKTNAAEQPAAISDHVEQAAQIVSQVNQHQIKAAPVDDSVVVEDTQLAEEAVDQSADIVQGSAADVRQATQATPTQSTTPPNFVQQFIQNSPIGQFISQLTGNPNQQSAQTASDEPAAPVPTIPGFLNPAAAITSAQQAVQNAAQSVVNSTTQAFQGLQQFASNLGNQFQSTLSNLGGQQSQLSTSDSTTPRPPGPFQSIVTNFVGGGNNPPTQQQPAPAPGQPQGPLQGILNFFQPNRPQSNAATGAPIAAATPPQPSDSIAAEPPKEEVDSPNHVDDKIGEDQDDAKEQEADATNEVRNSEEVGEDSFEDAQPDELIVVNDDANHQEVTA